MNDTLDTITEGLADEIALDLVAVDVFRAEGREPIWRPEIVAAPTPEPRSPVHPAPASAH